MFTSPIIIARVIVCTSRQHASPFLISKPSVAYYRQLMITAAKVGGTDWLIQVTCRS